MMLVVVGTILVFIFRHSIKTVLKTIVTWLLTYFCPSGTLLVLSWILAGFCFKFFFTLVFVLRHSVENYFFKPLYWLRVFRPQRWRNKRRWRTIFKQNTAVVWYIYTLCSGRKKRGRCNKQRIYTTAQYWRGSWRLKIAFLLLLNSRT